MRRTGFYFRGDNISPPPFSLSSPPLPSLSSPSLLPLLIDISLASLSLHTPGCAACFLGLLSNYLRDLSLPPL